MLKKLLTGVLLIPCFVAVHASAFDIVLTNDDGWEASGIQAMKRALVDAGHTVILAGSLTEQSGSSAAFNTGGLVIVKQREDEGALEYSVALEPEDGGEATEGAEPVTAAMVGISIAEDANGALPDIVVSGINAGQNLGAASQISGTVGAVTAAISSGFAGALVPGIAISTDPPCDEEAEDDGSCEELAAAHYTKVAEFVALFIDTLEEQTTQGPLMPPGFGVNINYPPGESVSSATVNRQGQTFFIGGQARSLKFGCRSDCVNAPVGDPVAGGITGAGAYTGEEVDNADTSSNAAGNITVVAIAPDFTAGSVTERAITAGFLFNNKLARVLRAMGY
jgi:5'-nucleotidase